MHHSLVNKSIIFVATLLIGGAVLFTQNNHLTVWGGPDPTSNYVVTFDSTGSTYTVNWYGSQLPQMDKMGTSYSSKRLTFFNTTMTDTPTSGSYTFPVSRGTEGGLGLESGINNGYPSSTSDPNPHEIPNIQYVKVVFTGTAPTIKGTATGAWGMNSEPITSGVPIVYSTLKDNSGNYFTSMNMFMVTFPNYDTTTIISSIEVGYNC